MTASIVQFPSRGRYSCREQVSNEPATVRGRALLAFTRSNSRTDINPARIVIRCNYRIPSISPQTGNLALEAGAYCCRLEGLFSIRGASVEFLNFCRFLTGWSLPRNHLRQKPTRGLFQAFFKSFRGGWALRHVSKHDSGVTQDVGTIDQRRGFFSQGVGCV